jgi:N-acetylmuramoyl-L-alanine amidase
MRAFIVAAMASTVALPALAQTVGQTAEKTPDNADVQCVAEAIYHEARGTSEKSQEAVAHVIVNRAESEAFPDDVCGVVKDGCQFSYECDGKSEAMTEPEARKDAVGTAEAVLEGKTTDPTGGALYYHNGDVRPGWVDDVHRTAEIDGQTFYRPR